MTLATEAQWAPTRRPMAGVGLNNWEARLTSGPVLAPGHLGVGMEEVERALETPLRRVADMCASPVGYQPDGELGLRLRPLIALCAADGGKECLPSVITAAVVVELTHLGTVWHDRVRPVASTPDLVADSRLAILAGDLLYAEACRLILGLAPQSMKVMAEGIARMAEGQLRAAAGPAPGEEPLDHYWSVVAGRSGALLGAAAGLGGIAGGVDDDILRRSTAGAECLAVAAQFSDDIIDTNGNEPTSDGRDGINLPALVPDRSVARQVALAWAAASHAGFQGMPATDGRELLIMLVNRAVAGVH